MSDEAKVIVAVCIKNVLVVVCFVVLAVVFNHWWIVLFSVLFLSSIKWGKDG